MPDHNLAERLAELLELPVEIILAYGKPQRRVSLRAARKRTGTVVEAERPPARLMTLKEAGAPLGKEVPPRTTHENELYRQWCEVSDQQKPGIVKRLNDAVLKHARAVIWQQLEEQNPDLAQNIAAAVIMRLATFRQKSKFSTWVEGIARKQIKQELRRRTRSRKVFDDHSDLFKHVENEKELEDPKATAAYRARILLETVRNELSPEDYFLLEGRTDGMTMAETAEKLGVSENTAESRWRRLRSHLRKKLQGNADGK